MSDNPLYDLVHQGESVQQGYDAFNRGTYIDDKGKQHMNPRGPDVDLSQMTVGDVQKLQALDASDPKRLFAVGYYQMIPPVMNEAVAEMGIDPKAKFTPELQDKIFSNYIISDKRPDIKDYITGQDGATLKDAQLALAKEWASFADPTKQGASHYPPPNASSITLDQQETALNKMRDAYQANIKSGMSAEDAWNAVAAVDPSQRQKVLDQPAKSGHANAQTDGALRQGDRGDAVKELQGELHDLGYKDSKGNLIQPDGNYGPDTKAAVKAFQENNQLGIDGVAGTHTREALKQREQSLSSNPGPLLDPSKAPRLDEPSHPGNDLYQQAFGKLCALDAQFGRSPDQRTANLAGSATVAALSAGIGSIDYLLPDTKNGSTMFVGQNTSPLKTVAEVPTVQGMNTPLEQSSAQYQQVAQQQAQTQVQQQAQAQTQGQGVNQQPAQPSMQIQMKPPGQ